MTDHRAGRERLGFDLRVCQELAFLIEEWGFRLVTQTTTFVRFESRRLFIQVFHGRISYEVGVEFGWTDRPDDPFPLALATSRDDERFLQTSARTPDRVAAAVRTAADLVREFVHPDVLGTREGREAVAARSAEARRQLALRSVAYKARPKALSAFRSRDWETVVREFSKMEPLLSNSERKKLELARARVRGGHR